MPRIVDHDVRRRELLGQALGLFAAKGYNGLSMRQLARELGVSTGTLYHYFPGKDALFATMFRQLAADAIQATSEAAPEGADRTERLSILASYVQSQADVLSQALRIAQDVHRLHGDAAGPSVVDETLGLLAAAIQDQLALPDPALGRVVLSFLLGTLVHRQLAPDHVDLEFHLSFMAGLGGLDID